MKGYIGLRTIKTGISVCLSVIVSNMLKLEYPFFVCMTAIVSMDKTAKLSLKMGRNRVFGTLCGASLGLLFNYIDAGNPFLCGLGIILLILFLNKLNMQGAIGISGIVFSAMMVHLGDKSPLLYGIHRTLDSFVGASITCLVNLMILPYYNVEHVEHDIEKLKEALYLCKDSIQYQMPFSIEHITKLSKDLEFKLDLYMHEIMSVKNKNYILDLCAKYRLIKDMIDELEILMTIHDDEYVFHYHLSKIEKYQERYLALSFDKKIL